MTQCVPRWDIDDPTNLPSLPNHHHPEGSHVLIPENEVAELTWKNGHLSMQGLAHPRMAKPAPKYNAPPAPPPAAWEKPGPGGTLESLVDQATRAQSLPSAALFPDLAAWPHRNVPPPPAAVDAVVPCSSRPQADPASGFMGSSGGGRGRKRARPREASQGSAGPTGGSTRATLDTCEEEEEDADQFTPTSVSPSLREGEGGGSPDTENTSFGSGQPPTVNEHDSVGHSRRSVQRERGRVGDHHVNSSKGKMGRSTISTKRSRAAAVHNQSERKRRDRINQKMRTLQKLVPTSSKTDKASMLDEVIEYLKQLQAQVKMMSRIGSIPPMMMPMNMQQLQMSMMAQMAHMTQMAQMAQMGMGMMDLSAVRRAGNAGMPPVIPPSGVLPVFPPAAFFPFNATHNPSAERLQPLSSSMFPDPFSAMHASPTQQPIGMDAFNRITALYQQLYQQNGGPNSQ